MKEIWNLNEIVGLEVGASPLSLHLALAPERQVRSEKRSKKIK